MRRRKNLGVFIFSVGLALATVTVVWLVATQPPPVTTGIVVDRKYVAAHTTTYSVPKYMTTIDANGWPKQILIGFDERERHHPDRWYLRLKGFDNRDGWIEVSPADYERFNNGDTIWEEL